MRGLEFNLADLMRDSVSEDNDESEAPKILPEAAVMRLKDVYEAYSKPNPFKPGDLVTLRADAGVRQTGEPHIVLEIESDPYPFWSVGGDLIGSSAFGHIVNVRVASVTRHKDSVGVWWLHHWQLEPYTGPGAK